MGPEKKRRDKMNNKFPPLGYVGNSYKRKSTLIKMMIVDAILDAAVIGGVGVIIAVLFFMRGI